MLLQSCATNRVEFRYISSINSDDIPDFPQLEYMSESEDGNYVTVDAFWFQRVADYKLRMDDVKEVLRRVEELRNDEK